MKGIILAGGAGTRLFPMTRSVSKQLIPVYDKPLIYYSLSTLIYTGVKDILCISTSNDQKAFKKLLGTGEQFGVKINYEIQNKPNGIAEAFLIAENFIKNSKSVLILGDNIFYGLENTKKLLKTSFKKGARIFSCEVQDPSRYGVLNFNKNKITSIVEKPKNPSSNLAVTGLYFYDEKVTGIVKKLSPSKRSELEITDVNNTYISLNQIDNVIMNNNVVWLDAGTPSSLLQASQFVQTIQDRQNKIICSPEEASLKMKNYSFKDFNKILKSYPNNDYSNYLRKISKK